MERVPKEICYTIAKYYREKLSRVMNASDKKDIASHDDVLKGLLRESGWCWWPY